MIRNICTYVNEDKDIGLTPLELFDNDYENWELYQPAGDDTYCVDLDKIVVFQANENDDYESFGFLKFGDYWIHLQRMREI